MGWDVHSEFLPASIKMGFSSKVLSVFRNIGDLHRALKGKKIA